jgi:hypothetical protein
METETFASILQSDAPPLVMLILGSMLFYYMLTRNSATCVSVKEDEDAKVDITPIKVGITHVIIRPTNGIIHTQREVAEDH